jgi:hypothetical protein
LNKPRVQQWITDAQAEANDPIHVVVAVVPPDRMDIEGKLRNNYSVRSDDHASENLTDLEFLPDNADFCVQATADGQLGQVVFRDSLSDEGVDMVRQSIEQGHQIVMAADLGPRDSSELRWIKMLIVQSPLTPSK